MTSTVSGAPIATLYPAGAFACEIDNRTALAPNQASKGHRGRRQQSQLAGPRSVLAVSVAMPESASPDLYCDAGCMGRLWDGPGSVGELFERSSSGIISFPGRLLQHHIIEIAGRAEDLVGCDQEEVVLLSALANMTARFGQSFVDSFDHIAVFFPDGVPGCSWAGTGNLGGRLLRLRTAHPGIVAHEVGHNLGLQHAGTDWEDDGQHRAGYGDDACFMGNAEDPVPLNAPMRLQLGWLIAAEIAEFSIQEVMPSCSAYTSAGVWQWGHEDYRGTLSQTATNNTCRLVAPNRLTRQPQQTISPAPCPCLAGALISFRFPLGLECCQAG